MIFQILSSGLDLYCWMQKAKILNMRPSLILLAMFVSLCAYSQSKMDTLADYCMEVRNAYLNNNLRNLEQAIEGYYPSTSSNKAEFFFNGTELDLSVWDDEIQIKGKMEDSMDSHRYFDPSSVDTYIAYAKGDVVINEIPLLRAAPYDFLYTNFTVDKASKADVKASCLGETHLLITTDSSEPVIVSVKCSLAKFNEKVTLDSTSPLEIFSWECNKETDFTLTIENRGDKPISVFIAKD